MFGAAALFLVWLIGNVPRMIAEDEGLIRFVLGLLFSVLILLRWKPLDARFRLPAWTILTAGCGGALLAVLGIVFRVHQFEWLGLILVLYACLGWTLPARFSRDLVLALLLLYWVHPLPGRVFGGFQLIMQLLSVSISQWVLHVLNVRVWADGIILYSAGGVFGVPESCSGMRAVVTVFLCTLGAGVLLRLRWYELPAFIFIGILQVLLLNVVRIAGMVIWAPRMPVGWAENFLHDTLGIFLLVSILLIQIEISLWKFWSDKRRRIRHGIRNGELEPPDLGTVLPGFWRRLVRWGGGISAILLLVSLTGIALYKSREEHRIEMIRGTVSGIAAFDPEVSRRAIARVLAFDPDDREMRNQLIRVLLDSREFEEALEEIGRLDGELSTLETIWKAWALMALDRVDEAVAVVDILPERTRRIPGVAIIRAEFAARKDMPEDVSRNVVLAADWPLLTERIRALFPYLATREQWWAIARCNSSIPFTRIEQALLSIAANLQTSNVTGAEETLRLALDQWPHDPRFLRYLGWVALNRRDKDWEDRLAANFTANIMDLSSDVLAGYLGTCFRLRRPDLAWLAYLRLQQIDDRDPALYLAIAQFGNAWAVFRRRDLELPSAADSETLDLSALYSVTENMTLFSNFWAQVPMRSRLIGTEVETIRNEHLQKCLAELEHRNSEGTLSFRMQIMYPFVLALSERYDEAHAMLDQMMQRWPDKRAEVFMRHATLYTREARWEEAYETLREYAVVSSEPTLSSELMNINAMMSLNMGIAAMDVVSRTRRLFPRSPRLDLAEVSIWETFGFKDQALFLLRRAGLEKESRAAPQLLCDAGYVDEARILSKAMGVRIAENAGARRQALDYPRAELSIARRFPAPLSAEELVRHAETEEAVSRRTVSPFTRALSSESARWYRAGGNDGTETVEKWNGIGRDDLEKATALHRLALLAARQGRNDLAVRAVRLAVTHLPESAILRRMFIGLTEGDREVVEDARRMCPDDPEIWLAFLVTRLNDDESVEWAAAEIASVISAETMPPSTIVRAGNFLFRKGMVDLASTAARYCVDKRRGTFPAYVLALRCALAVRDWNWALNMALKGVEKADDPSPFYRTVVDIKMLQNKKDGEMVTALKFLQGRFPEDTTWSERLGLVYFQERDMQRALSVFAPVISSHIQKVRLQSLLLASEAARQQGNTGQAIGILEAARTMYPENIGVLNNLIYYLAMSPGTENRARMLLGELLDRTQELSAVLDTAAMVYLNSGDIDLAQHYMDRAMAILKDDDYSASETRLNSARVLFRSGKFSEAKNVAMEVSRDPDRGFVVDKSAAQLLRDIERALRQTED